MPPIPITMAFAIHLDVQFQSLANQRYVQHPPASGILLDYAKPPAPQRIRKLLFPYGANQCWITNDFGMIGPRLCLEICRQIKFFRSFFLMGGHQTRNMLPRRIARGPTPGPFLVTEHV